MTFQNPFSDYGGLVTGARFVGRESQIKQIRQRMIGNAYGNIAIMGLPRVGKSSLAWNSLIVLKEELLNRQILSLWIAFGEISSLNEFISEILFQVLELIDNSEVEIYNQLEILKDNYERSSVPIEKKRYAKKFLTKLKSNKYRLLIILDEFDNAQDIFSVHDFQFLREISYNVETKVGLLTISRKTIQELEPNNGALSNFYQIFTDLNLSLFNEKDIKSYWDRITGLGVEVTSYYQGMLYHYVGNHPYLLDIINYEIFNQVEQSDINLGDTFKKVVDHLRLKIYNEFEATIKLMAFEHLSSKLMQMIEGPVYDISKRDSERLLKYGIVIPQINKYTGFSEYFTQYLKLKAKEINIWPLWSEVEQEIRLLIKTHLFEKYGTTWEDKFLKQFPTKKSTIDYLRKTRDKNIKLFREMASTHLVDYTYPLDMMDCFIHSDWRWFSAIFSKQFNDWKPIFEHLSRIRNPLAHNNPDFLSEADKKIAEGYCQNIMERIINWKRQKNKEFTLRNM